MAVLAIGAVGAAIGYSAVGTLAAAQFGFSLATTLYSALNVPDGPSAGDLSAPDVQEGGLLVRPYGTVMLTVNPVSVSDYTATANDTGGKGGPPDGSAGYTYTLDVLGTIAHRVPSMPLIAVTRVWVNKKLVETRLAASTSASLTASAATTAYTSLTLYPGGSAQVPPPQYETRVGTANASAYRNVATVEIIGLSCGGSKTPPLVEVEVITAGTVGSALTLLQSRFATNANDESAYAWGAPNVSATGVAVGGGVVTITAPDANPHRVYYAPVGLDSDGILPLTFEAIIMLTATLPITPTPGLTFNLAGGLARRFTWPSSTGYLAYDDSGIGIEGQTAGAALNERIHVAMVFSATSFRAYAGGLLIYENLGNHIPNTDDIQITVGDVIGGGPAGLTCYGFRVRQEETYTGASFTPPTSIPDPDTAPWVIGTANLQSIVDAELALNPAITPADHNTSGLSAVTVRGFKAIGPPGKSIAELGDIFYFDCIPASPIKYVRRGVAVVGTIANVDTGVAVDEAGAPFTGLKIGNDIERPSVVGLSAPNASADHEPVFRRGDRLTTDGPDIERRRTDVGLTPAEVQGRALAMTLMARASAHTAEYGLSDKYAVAEPGDAYNAYDDQGNLYNTLIRSLTYSDGVKQCKWELNDTSALVETGITDATYTPSLIVATVPTLTLIPLDIPILRDADNDDFGNYSAVDTTGDTFAGATVVRSVDNLLFNETVATHTASSYAGTTTTALGNWTGGYVWDEINSVTVNMGPNNALSGATHAAMQLDALLNVGIIGRHGRWEVIRFRNATLIAANTYTLSGLLRGMRGTNLRMGAHVAGDTFVLATLSGLRRMVGALNDIGRARYLKVVATNQSAASATSQSFITAAVGQHPFSPTNFRAARDVSNNATLTWNRRTRLGVVYGGAAGSYAPLGEATERYRIDVYTSNTFVTKVRTISATSQTASYTAAEQTTDGLTPGNPIHVTIYQIGTSNNLGSYLQASA